MIDESASSVDDDLVAVSAGAQGARGSQPSVQRHWLLALAGLLILLALATVYHYAIYLPQPNVPHRLMLLDDVFALGVFGLVALVGLALGRRALRFFHLPGFSRLERGALALGLGWGILSLGVLALGLAQALYSWLLLAGLLALLAICWRDAWQLLRWCSSAAPYRRLGMLVPQGFFLRALLLIMLLEVILLGTQALTLPYAPRGVDVYQYHWAVPDLYLLHHAIYALPGWAHANFPYNAEMLNTLALAAEAPAAAVLLQAAFGVLAIILIVGFLYRRFGQLAAWLGLAVSLGNNLLAGVLVSGYSEPAAAYYAVAALVVALAWLDGGPREGRSRLLGLAGLLAGLGLGVKYTDAQTLIGTILLLVVVWAARLPDLRRQGVAVMQALKRFALALLTFGAATLAAIVPWLLKDWALLGNPIYPFVWGGPEWDAARTEVSVVTFAHFGPQGPLWQRLLTGFLLLFRFNGVDQSDEPFPIPPNYLYLLVILLPLIWLAQQALRRRTQAAPEANAGWGFSWLLVAAVGYGTWLLSGAPVARYALPWVLLLSVPCAVLLARAAQGRWRLPFWRALFPARVLTQGAVLLAALVALFYVVAGWSFTQPLPLLTGSISLRQFEERSILNGSYWHMVDYVEQHVPHDARLLLVGNGAGYFLRGFDYVADSGEDWIPYLETEGRTPAGMLALLRQDHFRYVVYDEFTLSFVVHTYGNHYLAHFLPAFRQFLADSLVPVWSYQTSHLYRVPEP